MELRSKMIAEGKKISSDKKDAKDTTFLSPSEYSEQISMNPENIIRKKTNCTKKQQTAFTSNPKIVTFQRFTVGDVYNITLEIQNTSEVSRQLRLVKSNDTIFKVVFKEGTLNTRLAPGMSLVYDVEFRPDEEKDYFHEISFKTDLGYYIVPVIAAGPRALLSLPDQIDMEQTALKVTKTKPILMINTGDKNTGFSIFTDNQYFTVAPSKGSARVGEAIQLTVNFLPLVPGIAIGHIFLRYDSGDTVQITIYGEGMKCDVRALEDNIVIESTYLGLSRLATIEIQNPSDYLLSFKWMNHKSIDDDLDEKAKCESLIEPDKILKTNNEMPKSAEELIRRRICADSIELLKNTDFIYNNKHFDIYPTDGLIWPCKTTQVTVNFQPKDVGCIDSTAYLEVGGLEHRIPVCLSGKCLGPALELNILSLDIQDVYLCSTYNYEVVCKNAGPIPGTLAYLQKTAEFGSSILVEPSEINVNASELKSMKLSFRSNRTGCFVERVDFLIKESSEILSFVIKGNVTCPLIPESSKEINFESSSLGFTTKNLLCLRNLSHESIEFSITVPSDGYENCITHQELAKSQKNLKFPDEPREFYICPSEAIVQAQSTLPVQIFYTPNTCRVEDVDLRIDLCNSSNAEPLILPMRVDAKPAIFHVTPAHLRIRFCFINHPYCRSIAITNVSDIEGYFYISPQEVSDDTSVLYLLSSYQGCVKSHQSKEISVTLIVKSIGEHKLSLGIQSLGLEEPITWCDIICTAQGPAMTVDPSCLSWGETKLLEKKYLTLNISNDSPISAGFATSLSKTKGIWEIEPPSGELEPDEAMTLNVSIFLRDTGTYSDSLVISISNGKTINVPLAAIGVGTSIVFCPEIFPTLDIGTQFRRQAVNIPIKIKNEGTKFHHIVFTNGDKNRQSKKSVVKNIDNTKFQIEPNVVELLPGQSDTLYCKIYWNSSETVTEQWYVNATMNGQGKGELLGTSTFTATFVEPKMIFDKSELSFRLDLGHDFDVIQQKDELSITNQCGRSVTADITVDKPFILIDQCNCSTDCINVSLMDEESMNVRVYFPFDVANSDTAGQKWQGHLKITYDEHKKVDKILCKAEVNFPHLNLIPNKIELHSAYKSSTEEQIKFENDSPLPVIFKIKWLKKSFVCESLVLKSRDESEGALSDKNLDIKLRSSKSESSSDAICLCDSNNGIVEIIKNDVDECEEGWSESSSEKKTLNCLDLVDQLLQITPTEGKIPPHTSICVTIKFNGRLERALLSIQALCEVKRGSAQLIYVNATSDTVRCDVQDRSLDFGLQLFSKPSITMLRVINRCFIPLKWDIEISTNLLRVLENSDVLDPNSERVIAIERLPSAPGLFMEKIYLEVIHMEPFIIDVMWFATIPQIYLDLPRLSEILKYPLEFGYQALQLLSSEWNISQELNPNDVKCSVSDVCEGGPDEFSEYELMQFRDDNWEVIVRKDEICPNEIDIDMAFERLLVKNYVEAKINNNSFTSNFQIDNQQMQLPLAPSYVINMNNMTVEQTEQLLIPLHNYGFEKVKITLKRDVRSEKFPESCFAIRLGKNTELCQCESDVLDITFKCKKEMFSAKRTDLSCRFYLEVKYGLRVPVTVNVTVFYSDVFLSTQILNFDKVYLGTCREMSFLLENDEYVECKWEMFIAPKNFSIMDNPFFIDARIGSYNPGEKVVVKVYFRPSKNTKWVAELVIHLLNGQNAKRIQLSGYGIQRKLDIDKLKIRFPPIIPNQDAAEDYITIENHNTCEIELYWQHKNDFSELNRAIRIFKYYTKELFVPGKKINENIQNILLDFYNSLIIEMKNNFGGDLKQLVGTADSNSEASQTLTNLHNDPNELEIILRAYIDKMQKDQNFHETMRGILSALYENQDFEEKVGEKLNDWFLTQTTNSKKKLIIIYHGAPFTEYEETACRNAKDLDLPVLNLNQLIIEGADQATTASSLKLAEQINRRYQELTTKFEKLTVTESARSAVSEEPSKLLRLLKNIPPAEEFERLDSYTTYELKLEIISSLAEIVDSKTKTKATVKGQDANIRKPNILPNFNQDMFREILHERLSQPQYDRGYVLQTLNNGFIGDECIAVKALLEATGDASTYLLISFHNSFESCEQRISNLSTLNGNENKYTDSDEILKSMQEYENSINKLLEAIADWEAGKSTSNDAPTRAKSRKEKNKPKSQEIPILKSMDKFFIWHVLLDESEDLRMYDATIANVSRLLKGQIVQSNLLSENELPSPSASLSNSALPSKTYFDLKEYNTTSDTSNDVFCLSSQRTETPALSENDALHEPEVRARWILQPNESQKFQVKFTPTVEGRYTKKFALTLWDNPLTTYKIQVEGIAEIPRLDMLPSAIFNKVNNTKTNESHDPTYFLDSQTFSFGNLFVLPASYNQPHQKVAQFKFKNISAVLVSASFSVSGENSDCFDINHRNLTIEPDEVGLLNIVARARNIGRTTTADLHIIIEHNEQTETIKLECHGHEPNVEIEPKDINLKRVLLYHTESQMISVNNRSAISIYWRLSIDDANTQIRLTLTQGKIKGREDCQIELQYYADKVVTEDKKCIRFDVFINETDAEPIKSENLNVRAEIYEILFSIEDSNSIDLGNVPVRSASNKSFVIKNLGLYEIQYEVQYNDTEVLKTMIGPEALATLARDIKIFPTSGLLLPKKQAVINIIFTPSIELLLISVPLIKSVIIEPYKETGIVKEHLLNVSAVSYYTRFLIEPSPNLNFGTVALKSKKTMSLNITNTGQFPLKYYINSQLELDLNDQNSVFTKRDKKRQVSKPRVMSKRPSTLPNTSLKLGPFELEKTQGKLTPGQTDIIIVNCVSEIIGCVDEKLSILVSDSLPLDEDNQTISLIADICTADFDFNNYYEIFTESYVVNSLDEFRCSRHFEEYTVFSKAAKCLYFHRVCVGSCYTTSITLRNISPVDGEILLELTDSSSSSDNIFQISTDRLQIAPISKQSFTVTFTPESLGIVSCVLIVKVNLPQDIEHQKIFKINLEGEGSVPQIQILEPSNNDDEMLLMNFGLTFISTINEKICKIKNTGCIAAKISLKFLNNPQAVFSIAVESVETVTGDTSESCKLCFQIQPGFIANVVLKFFPTKLEKYEGSLKISIEHNPYDDITVNLLGEGFEKLIILENLKLFDAPLVVSTSKESKKRVSRDSSQKSRKVSLKTEDSLTKVHTKSEDLNDLNYTLDYGRCFLNQINKITFKIVNKTTNSYFRFEWDRLSNLVCTPTAGHLGPHNFKDVTATFLVLEPSMLSQIPLACKIHEITLDEPILEPLWDSRQTQVSWIEKEPSLFNEIEIIDENDEDVFIKKTVDKIEEPKYKIIASSVQKIQLLVFAIANYSEYQCDVESINFEDTLMFQTREYKFVLSNTGTVNLNFSWTLLMDEEYPRRLDQISWESTSTFESKFSGDLCPKKTLPLNKVLTSLLNKKLQLCYEEPDKKSDLFSSSAGLTDRSTDSWIEGENWPFEIFPESGSLGPGKSIDVVLKFAPVDVFEYKAHLQCKMENLEPHSKCLGIAVTARSLLPYYHFEIEDSDYLTSGRRDSKLAVPSECSLADPETRNKVRVVEFEIVGVGECQLKCICFVNPTCEDYHYKWTNLSDATFEQLHVVRCQSETGVAEKGKRTKTTFSFVPEEVGLFELFWKFEIKKLNLITLFLIVVHVVEPSVHCKNSIIELETSTVGQLKTTCFEIVNDESYPLSFEISSESLHFEGQVQTISVCPLSGELNPNSSQTFRVEFTPSRIGEYNFDVECRVEKLRKPLKIYISAQVLMVQSKVIYINLEDEEIFVNENCDNIVDFGELLLNKPTKIKFEIINNGQIAFDYSWNQILRDRNDFNISLSESRGRIEPSCNNTCYLEVVATGKVLIRNCPLTLKIKNGPSYRIKVNAFAKKPQLEFSFCQHDFGLCCIQTQSGIPYSVDLVITNHQKIPVSIECKKMLKNTQIQLSRPRFQEIIPPNSFMKIPIYFQPTEEVIYQEIFHFQTEDASIEKSVSVKGEGMFYKIRLKNPCDAVLNIGKIIVGNSISRKIAVVNEGRATATFKVGVIKFVTEDIIGSARTSDQDSRAMKNYQSAIESHSESNSATSKNVLEFVEVWPDCWVDLKPRKELKVKIKLKAAQRVKSFDLRLGLDVNSLLVPLTVLKGQCVAPSLHLNRTYISFGTVYGANTAEEKLVLVNSGDTDTKFQWNTENTLRSFTINPLNGYCPAGREVVFSCISKPAHFGISQTEAVLELQDYKNIVVTMVVNCDGLPDDLSGTINFRAAQFKSDTKNIKIENESDKPWHLNPKIYGHESRHFSVDKTIIVAPKSSNDCVITYRPESLKTWKYIDKGRLVIYLPDGRKPIVYDLCGYCCKENSRKKILRQLSAKRKYTESLVIYNDENEPQTFECRADELVGDKIQNVSTFKINVAGNSQTEYKFPFYFENEGQYSYKISFEDQNQNYQNHELEFAVTGPQVRGTLELVTYVRTLTFCNLKIENTDENTIVTYNAFLVNKDITVHGLPATLAPREFKNIRLDYLPLLPCDIIETLALISEENDKILYKLHLVAKPVLPEKVKYVRTSLGSAIDFTLTIKNRSQNSCEYAVAVNESAFTCSPIVHAAAGEEVVIDVSFEPYSLEKVKANVTVISNTAGQFIFPIIGECTKPESQGPYVTILNKPATITFKNVFLETKTFKISVNKSCFIVKDDTITIDSKKSIEITVELSKESSRPSSGEASGKVRVTCLDPCLSTIKWIYYVKGAWPYESQSNDDDDDDDDDDYVQSLNSNNKRLRPRCRNSKG